MQRKDIGQEHNTLKQHFVLGFLGFFCCFCSNTWKLAEEGKAQDYVSNPRQWHFTEKKNVTYESVQPCFVLHECFNRASVI